MLSAKVNIVETLIRGVFAPNWGFNGVDTTVAVIWRRKTASDLHHVGHNGITTWVWEYVDRGGTQPARPTEA